MGWLQRLRTSLEAAGPSEPDEPVTGACHLAGAEGAGGRPPGRGATTLPIGGGRPPAGRVAPGPDDRRELASGAGSRGSAL